MIRIHGGTIEWIGRVNVDGGVESLNALPEDIVTSIGGIQAVGRPVDHRPREPEPAHAALEFVRRRFRILHREVGESAETVRVRCHGLRKCVVGNSLQAGCLLRVLFDLQTRPGQRQHDVVNAMAVHGFQSAAAYVGQQRHDLVEKLGSNVLLRFSEVIDELGNMTCSSRAIFEIGALGVTAVALAVRCERSLVI